MTVKIYWSIQTLPCLDWLYNGASRWCPPTTRHVRDKSSCQDICEPTTCLSD